MTAPPHRVTRHAPIPMELLVTQQDPLQPRLNGPALPAGRPEDFLRHRAGDGCPLCANDYTADDIGCGVMLRRGEVDNTYLWRSGAIWTGVHHLDGRVAAPGRIDGLVTKDSRVVAPPPRG
ncbi:hypothetical protein GCM10009730_59230 [Streptomyces albidochromogenes]